jgi:Protein of unknown function (DUF1566)
MRTPCYALGVGRHFFRNRLGLPFAYGATVAALACGSALSGSNGDGGFSHEGGSVNPCMATTGPTACGEAVPLEWAQWPMPNDLGDVKAGAPNPASYTDNQDGTITDNVTTLMWQKDVPAEVFVWDCGGGPSSAQAYCASLSLAGHDDWRLPTAIELVTLFDFSGPPKGYGVPMLDTAYFNVESGVFWSTTLQSIDDEPAIGPAPFGVDFVTWYGPGVYPPTQRFSARCVR